MRCGPHSRLQQWQGRLQKLQGRFRSLKLATSESIEAYTSRASSIIEALEAADSKPADKEVVMAILNGLPESYSAVKAIILDKEQLPGLEQLVDKLILHEGRNSRISHTSHAYVHWLKFVAAWCPCRPTWSAPSTTWYLKISANWAALAPSSFNSTGFHALTFGTNRVYGSLVLASTLSTPARWAKP